jgi:hypothetical protein
MVASVDSYVPPPGRNMAHYLTLDVDKAGHDNVSIADALQRYLNVRPTRKPGGDPRDIGSLDSFPTLVIDEDQAWADPLPYKFSVNGVVQRQSQPTFFARGGALRLRVIGRGVSTVSTPATEPKPPLAAGPPPGSYYPPEVAAQMAMRRLTDMFDDSGQRPPLSVGPDLVRTPNDVLEAAAQTLAVMNAPPAGPPISRNVRSGLNYFSNINIYNSSPQLYLTAVAGTS